MRRLVLTLTLLGLTELAPAAPVDFARDVRPIFEKHCVGCHGAEKRRGGLRLTSRADVLMPTDSGKVVLVPGHPDRSPLLDRVTTEDDRRMPPKGDRLSAEQATTLRAWIEAGAPWPETTPAATHWAYVKPTRPLPPTVKERAWPRNAIDAFVLARLEKEGLRPSPAADRPRLLRRVWLDLVGLPPSPADADAFLADDHPDAYERVVDKLLASPQYGERWARPWLDLARYADSNGFQRDGFRDIWAYRDWVVEALNADMPFDRFTIEQLAGDLLPDATPAQKIATGFHRCATVNVEAGTDQEENRVNQVFDRVSTTGTVWIGTTLECAQCHNHKYDPVTQRDYYRLFAFFNGSEIETKLRGPNASAAVDFVGPAMELPDADANERAALERELKELDRTLGPAPKKPAAKAEPADPKTEGLRHRRDELTRRLKEIARPQTLVMKELTQPRETAMFRRGNFLDRGERVTPGVPEFLHPLPAGPANRLTLARWLVSKDNPLVARVTVNRWWAEFFGQGLVTTPEDFGTRGERPSHPELLDWLAVEFMERGWSMKAIHRLIVTSATYRQSSNVTPELLARDDRNRWYARGPRFRLEAETIRDNALSVAGLLSLKRGGPPVRPYQPDGVWKVTGLVDNTYRISEGEDRYRRGLYVVWRRSAVYPSFVNFDAPIRTTCTVKRSRSNTPLQALTLLNDRVYIEAALGLARRVLTEEAGDAARLRYAFRVCLTRTPTATEAEVLSRLLTTARARYADDPKAAGKLVGGFALPKGTDAATLAAWYEVATVLLNLDETITKG
jgi:hypothetical protein